MEIRCWAYDLHLTHAWRTAGRPFAAKRPIILIELRDNDGHFGIGEAPMVRSVKHVLRKLTPRNLSFADLSRSMAYVTSISGDDLAVQCALNVALMDGAAKRSRQPIYDFLGLGFRERAFLTSFTIGIDDPGIVREKVRAAEPYPILKLKVGSPDDELNMTALREVAAEKTIRVDANEAWKSKEEALRNIEWLHRRGNVQFVEQPMPASAPVEDWIWLKERSPLPLYGDESYRRASDCPLAARCFHGVNVKQAKAGGIGGAMDALRAARDAGLKTMIGCMTESSVLVSAAAHLAALADDLDLDGNLLIGNDPYAGITAHHGAISFASAPEPHGLRIAATGAAAVGQRPLDLRRSAKFGRALRRLFLPD